LSTAPFHIQAPIYERFEYINYQKNEKKEYSIMPYDELLRVQEELDDYYNLRCLEEAKKAEQYAPTVSIEELEKSSKTPSGKGNS
jgi:hypothetical protein